ncbi:MAG: hypothetical protein AMXMBFR46_08960 [Acidimicrobiia bacterium]
MDTAERTLLEETVRDVVARVATEHWGEGAAGGVSGAAAAGADETRARGIAAAGAVDAALDDLGWREMLEAEPRDAVEIVFGALGAAGAAASVLDDVVVAALGMEPRPDLAVVLPEFGRWDPPASRAGDGVRATGIATARAASAAELVVVGADDGARFSAIVPRDEVVVVATGGVDPRGGWHRVGIDLHGGVGSDPLGGASWDAAVAAGRRAVGHQVAGTARVMLDLARTHALERVQFGRPIVRFQAVRHRLAETLVAIEALEATLAAAWDEGGSLTAALAKVTAGRSSRTVAAHCQQVLAGIGFTTDHPFHLSLKRNLVLDGLFGTADDVATAIGRDLIATRTAPKLIEL